MKASDLVREADFQAAVIELARLCGWRVAHFHDSRRQVGGKLVGDKDAAGFPDLVMVRLGELLFVELKSAKGGLTRLQWAWMDDLSRVAECYTWRPADWSGIERRLS